MTRNINVTGPKATWVRPGDYFTATNCTFVLRCEAVNEQMVIGTVVWAENGLKAYIGSRRAFQFNYYEIGDASEIVAALVAAGEMKEPGDGTQTDREQR